MQHSPQPHQPSLHDDYFFRQLVPPDHELLQIDQAVDFSFVHATVADLYCPDNGRPATSPELLLRLCVLQRMYGLSDRGVMARAQTDLAFRAFLHLRWEDRLPDHSTLHVFRSRLGGRFEAVYHLYAMPRGERRARHAAMLAALRRHDLASWHGGFLAALAEHAAARGDAGCQSTMMLPPSAFPSVTPVSPGTRRSTRPIST